MFILIDVMIELFKVMERKRYKYRLLVEIGDELGLNHCEVYELNAAFEYLVDLTLQ